MSVDRLNITPHIREFHPSVFFESLVRRSRGAAQISPKVPDIFTPACPGSTLGPLVGPATLSTS